MRVLISHTQPGLNDKVMCVIVMEPVDFHVGVHIRAATQHVWDVCLGHGLSFSVAKILAMEPFFTRQVNSYQ